MTKTIFFKEHLENLSNVFPKGKFTYYYDDIYHQDIIEVSPNSLYHSSKFAKEQIYIELEFIKKYPCEDLHFMPTKDKTTSEKIKDVFLFPIKVFSFCMVNLISLVFYGVIIKWKEWTKEF